MESLTPGSEVRLAVVQSIRTLSTSSDQHEIIVALQTLNSFLDSSPLSHQEEFRQRHYTHTLQFLINNIKSDWLHTLTPTQRTQLWDCLFLQGPPEQALLVLMEGIGQLSPSSNLDHLLSIIETFLQSGRLTDLLWSYCLGTGPSDTPQFREALLGRVVALPDLMANKLQLNNKMLFLPQNYYPLLAQGMLTALERTCQALKRGSDCSLTFLAQTLGKVCIQGHSGLVMTVLAPHLSKHTRTDMVWQRVCCKLIENVPQRWIDSVLTQLVQSVTGPEALGRIIGNLVVSNKKAQFVMTHKMLLLQYKYETKALKVVLGYLAADRERRPLLLQVLRSICQAWANPSAVKHTPIEQQMYISKALLLSVTLLNDSELKELRSELLQCLLGGMQSHLDSSVVQIRRIGMVVGECLSARMDINGTKLKFEYDVDEDIQELLSLMTPTTEDDHKLDNATRMDSPDVCQEKTSSIASQNQPCSLKSNTNEDSDLDSDDELTPYDMSCDQKLSQSSPPRYLRDCLEILTTSDDAVRVELSLNVADSLILKNPFATKEISVQMTKVLLHIENKYNIDNFLALRQATMVALTVTDCIPVTQYLTSEFYNLNYSLRQRLDILEVLALAAQELSKPINNSPAEPSISVASTSDLTSGNPEHWTQVVEKRIQSKTKRLTKVISTLSTATIIMFWVIHSICFSGIYSTCKSFSKSLCHCCWTFFLPLLQNYDKLIHTLGLFMHLALNAPVAAQMGCALLDFVWTVRYHTEQTVRRGVLFAVCSVFLSMPSQNLLLELGDSFLKQELDVAERDADSDCRSLALQCLVHLDKGLKKQLQHPQALSLES
ncbi:hypothetical protein WMY93_011014 [Mugilogobius chulae]|uniref:Telomere length regulation protein TEL2 homolog n=1 Tax=Mugilogobius chulae TaxID=88201 RepID=A0AAW0P9B0_9GOBI